MTTTPTGPGVRAALVVVGFLIALTVLGPLAWTVSPTALDLTNIGAAPSIPHPLGTDESGRDVLSRLLAGGRVSLSVGLLGMSVAVAWGALVGALAGTRGGWTDAILMRLTDSALAMPTIFVSIVLLTFLGPSITTLVLAIGSTTWMSAARVIRGQVAVVRTQSFVEAARSLGAPAGVILFRHVVPHVLPLLLVNATLGVATAILTESALSYLGLGIQPPAASWGNMLSGAQTSLSTYPWLAVYPGVMILVTVGAVHRLGESLHRILVDPSRV